MLIQVSASITHKQNIVDECLCNTPAVSASEVSFCKTHVSAYITYKQMSDSVTHIDVSTTVIHTVEYVFNAHLGEQLYKHSYR